MSIIVNRTDQLITGYSDLPPVALGALVRDWNPAYLQGGQILVDAASGNNGMLGTTTGVDASDPIWNASPPHLTFNGTSHHVQLAGVAPTAAFEVQAIVNKVADIAVVHTIFSMGNSSSNVNNWGWLFLGVNDSVRAQMVNSIGTAFSAGNNTPLAAGWHMIGMSFDGTTLRCWRNTIQEATTGTPTGTFAPNRNAIGVLWRNGLTNYNASGVGRVLVFNRELTVTERSTLYSYLKITYTGLA
jgi:hypothetical protein